MRVRTIVLGLLAALALAGCSVPAEEPTAVQPAEKGGAKSDKAAKPTTVKMTATKAAYKPSALGGDGPYSFVKVTVTNQRKGNLAVNPLYFSLVDTKGEKHESSDALGAYEGELSATTLAPGEKAKGTICAKGKFTPKIIAMTNELLQEQARAEVA